MQTKKKKPKAKAVKVKPEQTLGGEMMNNEEIAARKELFGNGEPPFHGSLSMLSDEFLFREIISVYLRDDGSDWKSRIQELRTKIESDIQDLELRCDKYFTTQAAR